MKKNNNSRRDFIKKSAALALGTLAASAVSNTFAATENTAPLNNLLPDDTTTKFSLAPLPYSYDALEPHIDKLTMEIHHGKHHQAYVNNLNKALESVDKSVLGSNYSLETIFSTIDKFPTAIRNNAGGHYNHTLFWELMKKPTAVAEQAKGKLAEAINTSFGSFDNFKKRFAEAATGRFGSGWAWLVSDKGKLSITSTANQDNPLMNTAGIEIKGSPVLALDVWEHAYYLKNQNRRADYIASWWNVVNWDAAEKLYNKSI